jgi:hypothetical protein
MYFTEYSDPLPLSRGASSRADDADMSLYKRDSTMTIEQSDAAG